MDGMFRLLGREFDDVDQRSFGYSIRREFLALPQCTAIDGKNRARQPNKNRTARRDMRIQRNKIVVLFVDYSTFFFQKSFEAFGCNGR